MDLGSKKKKMLVALGFPQTLHFSSILSIGWFLLRQAFFFSFLLASSGLC